MMYCPIGRLIRCSSSSAIGVETSSAAILRAVSKKNATFSGATWPIATRRPPLFIPVGHWL